MNKKKILIIGVVALALAAGPYLSRYFVKSNPEVVELTTASVLDVPVDEKCDYQDEIDKKFLSLDASSGNYDVLYTSYKRRYTAEKYEDCEIPESRRYVNEDLEAKAEEIKENAEPIVEDIEGSESEISFVSSTYYEKSYGYVPEVPTPVFEYPAP